MPTLLLPSPLRRRLPRLAFSFLPRLAAASAAAGAGGAPSPCRADILSWHYYPALSDRSPLARAHPAAPPAAALAAAVAAAAAAAAATEAATARAAAFAVLAAAAAAASALLAAVWRRRFAEMRRDAPRSCRLVCAL